MAGAALSGVVEDIDAAEDRFAALKALRDESGLHGDKACRRRAGEGIRRLRGGIGVFGRRPSGAGVVDLDFQAGEAADDFLAGHFAASAGKFGEAVTDFPGRGHNGGARHMRPSVAPESDPWETLWQGRVPEKFTKAFQGRDVTAMVKNKNNTIPSV